MMASTTTSSTRRTDGGGKHGWNEIDHESEDCLHACLRYDEIEANGPVSRPIEFPTPTVLDCDQLDVKAMDHRSGRIHHLKGVIVPSRYGPTGSPRSAPRFAYLPKKKLCKSSYGSIRLCIVLEERTDTIKGFGNTNSRTSRRQSPERRDERDRFEDPCSKDSVEWQSTNRTVAIKISSWSKIHAMRGRHLEDPIKEISALQYVGNYHPHVAGSYECFQDEEHLYVVMPYYEGGDLYGRIFSESEAAKSSAKAKELPTALQHHPDQRIQPQQELDEARVRKWFRQILLGLFHLQKKGICHRDICLENILLNASDQAVIVDFGLCLRIPYSNPYNYGHVTDASAGPYRRLMKAQGQCGSLVYAAPEVLGGEEPFDGFATDLWATGVILFVLLVGLAPFKWAHPSDKRFATISKGGLRDLLNSLKIKLSDDACDLLQGMLWGNPRKRYSLSEVMQHPWVMAPRMPQKAPVQPDTQATSNVKSKKLFSRDSKVKGIILPSMRSSPSSCSKTSASSYLTAF